MKPRNPKHMKTPKPNMRRKDQYKELQDLGRGGQFNDMMHAYLLSKGYEVDNLADSMTLFAGNAAR